MANIPTEPIGSIPRPRSLIQAIAANPQDPALDALYDSAVRNTIAHTCPGSDLDSMHSADVDHAAPLPSQRSDRAG